MLIERMIELQLRRPEPSGRTCTPITGYFHDKTKILNEKSSSRLLFTAKMLQETMHFIFPYLD